MQIVIILIIGISIISILFIYPWKNKKELVEEKISIIEKEIQQEQKESKVPKQWQENGIFSNYEEQAYEKLQMLSIDEKIAQLFLVQYPNENPVQTLKEYQFGGYVFFAKDFQNKTEKQVKEMLNELQSVSKIPIITAVDEEGGTVVRVSSNKKLAKNKFLSPKQLYQKRWLGRN